MKAVFKKNGKVYLKDVELPPPAPGQVRLKVDACGICGSDLRDEPGERGEERPFGHEIAGTILEVAGGDGRLRAGQRVVLDSSTPCGRCDACRNAGQELCTDVQSFWHLGWFGLAEEMLAPAISAIPYADLSPEVACLQEPLGVAIDMVRLAEVRPDSNVLIVGAGPIGLMALAVVRRMGARRVFFAAFESQPARAALVRRFGADGVVDPSAERLGEHDFGCGVDRVLVTAPPAALAEASAAACKGAIISFIGIAYGEGAYCRFDANAFHFKKLQLRASFASPALYGPMAIQYLRDGVVDGEAIISHRFSLADVAEAMATARDHAAAVKVVVMP
jgi:threonine dehydrogenase-like Zn-dependent dehydrogenase